jgi:hypothetical protein
MRITIPATQNRVSDTATLGTEVLWAKNIDEGFSKAHRYLHWWLTHEREATFWVYRRVHQLRINLDDPSGLYAAPQIRLLAPESGN